MVCDYGEAWEVDSMRRGMPSPDNIVKFDILQAIREDLQE